MNTIYFRHIHYLFILTFLLIWVDGMAQNEKYWVKFTDKNNSSYNLNSPEEFLSTRSITRRQKQGIDVDSTDLPVNKIYLDSIVQTGARIVCTSKWLNGATVETQNTTMAEAIQQFSFVDTVLLSWIVPITKSASLKFASPHQTINNDIDMLDYGYSYTQIAMHQGDKMHQEGFTGDGLLIAILDAGFQNADSASSLIHLFDNRKIIGTKDFVNPQSNIYAEHQHGMEVLSTMGAYEPGLLIGTAFDASFFLIRTEDANSEQPVELDYWVAGAEFADSIGADLINSSLGYYAWDAPFVSYAYQDMDGKSIRASIGASLAAKKGIIITNSAGNEGSNTYGKLISPSDGFGVVCVGSVNKDSTYTSFSSRGFSADGRVKPNLVANGSSTAVQIPNGDFSYINGTSFSSPITCGLLAILWQALPDLTAPEIIELAQQNANYYNNPDMEFGYGITNIYQAYTKATQITNALSKQFTVYPNPFQQYINIIFPEKEPMHLAIYTASGQLMYSEHNIAYQPTYTLNTNTLPQGIYILKLQFSTANYSQLISKQ